MCGDNDDNAKQYTKLEKEEWKKKSLSKQIRKFSIFHAPFASPPPSQ